MLCVIMPLVQLYHLCFGNCQHCNDDCCQSTGLICIVQQCELQLLLIQVMLLDLSAASAARSNRPEWVYTTKLSLLDSSAFDYSIDSAQQASSSRNISTAQAHLFV